MFYYLGDLGESTAGNVSRPSGSDSVVAGSDWIRRASGSLPDSGTEGRHKRRDGASKHQDRRLR